MSSVGIGINKNQQPLRTWFGLNVLQWRFVLLYAITWLLLEVLIDLFWWDRHFTFVPYATGLYSAMKWGPRG